MENLEKEFVVYPLAYRMKKLDFDKGCMAFYKLDDDEIYYDSIIQTKNHKFRNNTELNFYGDLIEKISAPTWQSAFDWFREKYNCHSHPTKYDETKWWVGYGTWTSPVFDSFYEAQMCWLERIIELAEMVELAKVVEQASNELNKK
jgi:hypothetical protein